MKTFAIAADLVSLAVTETGGHLADVAFTLGDGRRVSPMHTAPWYDEDLPTDLPPILRVLRGDFFCAPFGASDVIPGQTLSHGATANGTWRVEKQTTGTLDAVLAEDVMGATVSKHIELRRGHAVVYQRHTFAGGLGRLPVGHHAMLNARHPLQLGFAPWIWAGTPPDPIEVPPAGRSILAYPQTIANPTAARTMDGGWIDLTRYPGPDGYEDLWMLVADGARPFSWTAATCADDGWVWFGLKNPRVLPATAIWMSNGGRTYAPWSGRHRHIIGLEEVCSYLHLGHAASIADNPFSARGIPTAVTLGGAEPLVIPYAFGLAAAPRDFGAVIDVHAEHDGIVLIDKAGHSVSAAVDLSFLS